MSNIIKATIDHAANQMPIQPLKATLNIQCAGSVIPQRINWLWPNKIAKGKLSIISGDPGLGKSMLTTALAAHISCGSNWPVDNTPCPKGTMIMLSAEDDLADTIRPRLDAAGAIPEKVFVITMVDDVNQKSGELAKRSFSLADDIELLNDALIQLPDCQLITIDPISSYLGGTDSHNNADVRGLLAPLADLASKHNIAIVGITHLNKGNGAAMYRSMGSLAFVAAARAAFSVSKCKDDENRRLVLPIKNNLGIDTGGVAYRVAVGANGAPYIQWENEAVHITADDALNPDNDEREAPAKDEAREFLLEELSAGPLPVKELKKLASEAGHSWGTIKRAKNGLDIKATKLGIKKGWEWQLIISIRGLNESDHEGDLAPPHSNKVSSFENTCAPSTTTRVSEAHNSHNTVSSFEGAHLSEGGLLRDKTDENNEDQGEL